MDQYRMNHNNNLVEEQLDYMAEEINEDFENNRFSSFFSVVKSITGAIKNYLLNLGKPIFNKRKAAKRPDSKDYNKNMEEVVTDIENAYSELNTQKKTIKSSFNYSRLFDKTLNSKVKDLKDKADDLSLYIQNSEDAIIIASDRFKNMKNVDTDLTSCKAFTGQGVLTLGVNGFTNFATKSGTDIELLDDSNGFLGNKHQVKLTKKSGQKYSKNGKSNIKWLGEGNPHDDIATIADGQPDTWVEYELCNIPSEKKDDPCKGYGFKYSDGRVWAKDPKSGFLKMHIRITLPKQSIINWIDVNPYRPQFKGAGPIHINSIKTSPTELGNSTDLSDEKESTLNTVVNNFDITKNVNRGHADTFNADNVSAQNDYTGHGIFTFPPRKVKTVDIKLEQHAAYDCKIGHVYYERTIKKKKHESSWFGLDQDTTTTTNTKRVKGPPANNKAGNTEGDYTLGWGDSTQVMSDKTERKFEHFGGWRFALGVRGVNINAFTYKTKSKMVSTPFKTPGPIEKIELETSEKIPKAFYAGDSNETSYSNMENWIQYYVSIDGGSSWHRIAPKKAKITNYPKTYYVNANSPAKVSHPEVGYIENDSEVDSVRFKVVMKRPTGVEGAKHYSPTLESYKLKLTSQLEDE